VKRTWIALAVVVVVVGALIGYVSYVGVVGSALLVDRPPTGDCRTPDVQFGWSHDAINYDIGDDAQLKTRNSDPTGCTYQGAQAGDEVVTEDGIRVAGWYVPAGDGAPPTAATVVVVHGFQSNKSSVLEYAAGLHETFNLVVFDLRDTGRSTGTQTTAGVFEQRDLRAIVDWLDRTKHPGRIGLLGNSMGAVTSLAEAIRDPRITSIALDSMHTRMRYQIEARLAEAGHPSYPGTWGIFAATLLRTGADIGSIDAEDELAAVGRRPMLLLHGSADTEDLPERTQAFYEEAVADGIPAELHFCDGSGHKAPAGMPVQVCCDSYGGWLRAFFTRTLG
jgi:pimeloyl-ACP methyl ester carboxylesterase